jgi:hypothetical protein
MRDKDIFTKDELSKLMLTDSKKEFDKLAKKLEKRINFILGAIRITWGLTKDCWWECEYPKKNKIISQHFK